MYTHLTVQRNIANALGVDFDAVPTPTRPFKGCLETQVDIRGQAATVCWYDDRWGCPRWAVTFEGMTISGDKIAPLIADIPSA